MLSGDMQPIVSFFFSLSLSVKYYLQLLNYMLKTTLTGHEDKILGIKFLSDMKLATGSHDRSIKLWDLNQQACTRTILAGSKCNDLATLSNQSIISAHFNKKIHFWDARTGPTQNEILLEGCVTSLDISPGFFFFYFSFSIFVIVFILF